MVYKKVVLDSSKPSESFSTSLERLKKFMKIFKLNQTDQACFGKPTRDMTEIENVKIILVQ